MKHSTIVALMLVALTAGPLAGMAREPEVAADQAPKARHWSAALRVGGFSNSGRDGRWGHLGKFTGYDVSPNVTSGIDVSRFIGDRSGLTLSFEGLTFAGHAVVMAPMTVTYRYYPLGNGVAPAPGRRPPPVQPWIGAGGGLYAFILDDDAVTDTEPGAQASTGLLVPLSRRFDAVGELKYAVAGDARILSYTLGFGVRF